jgi:DNA-binding MarR family transcriptional regulator
MTRSLPKRQHPVNGETAAPRAPRPARSTTRTPAGDAFSRLVVQVFRLNGVLTAAGDEMARPAGQSSARWRVLAAADHAPMTVAQIARALDLARQSVQRVADLLVGDGLATYVENPGHRRAKLVALTPSGRKALRTIQAAQRVWADAIGAQIGEAELNRANVTLDKALRTLASERRHP